MCYPTHPFLAEYLTKMMISGLLLLLLTCWSYPPPPPNIHSRRAMHLTRLNAGTGFGSTKAKRTGINKRKTPAKNQRFEGLEAAVESAQAASQDHVVMRGMIEALEVMSVSPDIYKEPDDGDLEFFGMLPSLLTSRGMDGRDGSLERVGGFVKHYFLINCVKDSERKTDFLPDSFESGGSRPAEDVHAYMPGVGTCPPFLGESSGFEQPDVARLMEDKYETIKEEYEALVGHMSDDAFTSVTSMNYDAGWSSLCLHRNGRRIEGFPYHLCPTTLSVVESVPIAGRICGFNRQLPGTGIPEHTDGNAMWLTVQMALDCEPGSASITNGGITRKYEAGKAISYDTTYSHFTSNEGESERVVLHLDMWNTLEMTENEIEAMRYIYDLRQRYLDA